MNSRELAAGLDCPPVKARTSRVNKLGGRAVVAGARAGCNRW